MSKYQQYFQEMVELNKELFDTFGQVHEKYSLDPEKYQEEFNHIGEKTLLVIRKTENMLCAQQEGGKYGKYSTKLSEKFWEAIRANYPKIDYIGMR